MPPLVPMHFPLLSQGVMYVDWRENRCRSFERDESRGKQKSFGFMGLSSRESRRWGFQKPEVIRSKWKRERPVLRGHGAVISMQEHSATGQYPYPPARSEAAQLPHSDLPFRPCPRSPQCSLKADRQCARCWEEQSLSCGATG